jgi:hypothetical protein
MSWSKSAYDENPFADSGDHGVTPLTSTNNQQYSSDIPSEPPVWLQDISPASSQQQTVGASVAVKSSGQSVSTGNQSAPASGEVDE